jgi:hypothetical protein
MLDTLTGKIPEKLTQENSFAPLPTLEEMDGTNNSSSSSSILESIKNNWLAILATLLLIMFTVFNVLSYYSQKGDTTATTEQMFKSFDDAYKYVEDSIANIGVTKDAEAIKATKATVVAKNATSNQIPNITAGNQAGKNVAGKNVAGKKVRNKREEKMGEEEDEEEEEEEEEEENDDPNADMDALNVALENASQKKGDYKASDSRSSVGKSKAGWCFVGEQKGFRNCVEVGENDKCLSGDIFPTSQVCVNPSLRA